VRQARNTSRYGAIGKEHYGRTADGRELVVVTNRAATIVVSVIVLGALV